MKTSLIAALSITFLFAACGIEEEPAPTDETPAGPVCGDGTCDQGETYEACPEDCEETVTPTPAAVCGNGKCEQGETSLNCLKDCPLPVIVIPVPQTLPDPIKVAGKCELLLSNYYVSGSSCGEFLGNLPGTNWTEGMDVGDANGDGYYEVNLDASTMVAGTYEFSWKGYQNCSQKLPKEAWAQYGSKTQLAQMTVDARKCIYCNWIADDGSEKSVDNPSCGGKVSIAADCTIQCAGNAHLFKF